MITKTWSAETKEDSRKQTEMVTIFSPRRNSPASCIPRMMRPWKILLLTRQWKISIKIKMVSCLSRSMLVSETFQINKINQEGALIGLAVASRVVLSCVNRSMNIIWVFSYNKYIFCPQVICGRRVTEKQERKNQIISRPKGNNSVTSEIWTKMEGWTE